MKPEIKNAVFGGIAGTIVMTLMSKRPTPTPPDNNSRASTRLAC